VARESRLPGLASWARVRDWRVGQLGKLPNVEIYRESRLTAEDVLAAECSIVTIATGSTWRRDGIGRHHSFPLDGLDQVKVLTPDDVMRGDVPPSPVVVYDDDHYYMGGVVAEKLARAGCTVILVTTESMVSSFTQYTLEQGRIQARLIELGVTLAISTDLNALHPGEAELACAYTGRIRRIAAQSVVLVTMQSPDDDLFHALVARPEALAAAGIRKIERIGDALAPGTIAAAIWSGHRFAREFDLPENDEVDFSRENVELADL